MGAVPMDELNLDLMAVAGAPFGNSDYIHDQLHQVYYRRLERIAERLPLAADLIEALSYVGRGTRNRFLENPTVRIVIEHAFREVVRHTPAIIPFDQCARILEQTLHDIKMNYEAPRGRASTLSGLDRLGAADYHPYIWSDDNSDDPFRSVFRRLVKEHFEDQLASATSTAKAALERGLSLLEMVAPCITRSALSHVQLICLFPAARSWRTTASCSQFGLSGAVFLQLDSLEDPWWVAEHLLHEALHQKLYDIRVTHSLIARETVVGTTIDRDGCGNND
jgi:hypothetical protein